MNLLDSTWFYWAVGIAIGLPAGLIVLTELHNILVRRNSHLARQASLLRNYLLPLGAVLLLLVKASEVPAEDPTVRVLTTAFGFLVLVLLLSLLNATLFQGAPQQSWRKRLPAIFVDVARFALIGIGLAVILSYIWGGAGRWTVRRVRCDVSRHRPDAAELRRPDRVGLVHAVRTALSDR
ncbi:cyclic nucleotide-binding protein [Mycobacterium tuberculosis]|nr:cyclic nucleotide-binding protein [Mycobacterium tuberculosis]CNL05003.1 cyclic nucleotide-binding protein [Mycobacterium tuberculosis]